MRGKKSSRRFHIRRLWVSRAGLKEEKGMRREEGDLGFQAITGTRLADTRPRFREFHEILNSLKDFFPGNHEFPIFQRSMTTHTRARKSARQNNAVRDNAHFTPELHWRFTFRAVVNQHAEYKLQ